MAPQSEPDHSGLSPASRMTLPHFAHSERMRAAKTSGALAIETMKLGLVHFPFFSGDMSQRMMEKRIRHAEALGPFQRRARLVEAAKKG